MAIVLPLQQAQTLGTTKVLPLAVYAPETYIVPVQTIGNAFLSSLVYKSGSGTLTVNYFQTTVDDTTFERTDIDSHTVLTAPQSNADQLLCTSIHNKLYAEIIITGSSVVCGIIGTCVDQSSTSIDAFVKDNTNYNLSTDKGLIATTIDEDTGKRVFLRSKDGKLLIYGSIGGGYEVLDQATFSSGSSLGTIAAALDEADNKLKFLRTVDGRLQTNSNSSLRVAGRISEIVIDNTSWTPLPATALANRKAINIQNLSGQEIKLNYNNGIAGYVGIVVANGGERSYDMEDGIVIYAKSVSSTVNINVEEIS
jgi:hypothetical protein